MEPKDNGEESVYSESREEMVDSDEISPEEEGFMAGYDEAEGSEEEEEPEEEEEQEKKGKKKGRR